MAKILPTWPSGTSLADRAMEGERWQVLGCLYLSTYTFEVKTLGWEIESVKRQPLLHRKKSLLDYDVRRIRFRSFSRYTSAHSTT